MHIGGAQGRAFRALTERHSFVAHGLSLSLGSPAPLDEGFVLDLKAFLDTHRVRFYTEHLSYCSDDGHLYDLMPIPFTAEAVEYVAGRIRRVQDILERRIAVENVSYYAAPGAEMSEIEFLLAVLERADCDLLLDVNNIYVNSINHHYEAEAFLNALPRERIAYAHVAGHYVEAEDPSTGSGEASSTGAGQALRVDTHAAPVCDPVWDLLDKAYLRFGVFPTLLERDFNIPPLDELLREVAIIEKLQKRYGAMPEAAHA